LDETVNRCFNEVLNTIYFLVVDVIKPKNPEFKNTPREIIMNPRYVLFQGNTNVVLFH